MTEGQALRGEIADASAAAVPQMAPFMAAGIAGAKTGAKVGSVLGPRGKALGATLGAAVGAVAYYFPQAYRLDQHGKYLLMAPGKDRSGMLGFRCVVDAE